MSTNIKQYVFEEYAFWLRVWQDNAAVARQLDQSEGRQLYNDAAEDWKANPMLSPKYGDIESVKITLEQCKGRQYPISPKMKKELFYNMFISSVAMQFLANYCAYTKDRSLRAMLGKASKSVSEASRKSGTTMAFKEKEACVAPFVGQTIRYLDESGVQRVCEVLDHCNGANTGEFFIVRHQLEDGKQETQMFKLEEIESLFARAIPDHTV